MIISTGMANLNEIKTVAVAKNGAKQIILFTVLATIHLQSKILA